MISAKKLAEVRLEITFQVLIGELTRLESELSRLKLPKVLEIWEPEIIGKELYWRVKMLEERREEKLTPTGKKRAKSRRKEVASEIEGTNREGDREAEAPA